jgi:hypothetical protein
VVQVRDTLRYTAFLGAFAGVYVAVDEGLAALFGNKRCAQGVEGCRATGFHVDHVWWHLWMYLRLYGMQDLQVAGGGGRFGSWSHHPAHRVMLHVQLRLKIGTQEGHDSQLSMTV